MSRLALAALTTLLACLPQPPAPQLPNVLTAPDNPLERTWWRLCWPADDLAAPAYPSERYPHTPACDRPELVTWPGGRVQYSTDGAYGVEVTMAAAQWNLWAGREVFTSTTRLDARVRVEMRDLGFFLAGTAQHYKHRGELFANVTLAPNQTVYAYHVALHEFGHVLGLAHDLEIPGSLMHPGGTSMAITQRDLIAVRERYGNEAGW